MGGKTGDRLYYGKPMIYDDKRFHYMYPNEARLRNMTYGFSIHYDVDIEFTIITDGTETHKELTIPKVLLGRFPLMLQSDFCILKGLTREARFNMGECRNDPGGYFIIDGKEKVIVSQEKFGNNMLYIKEIPEKNIKITDKGSKSILGKSEDLLSREIIQVIGTFSRGDIVSIANPNSKTIALGIVNYNVDEIAQIIMGNYHENSMIQGSTYGNEVIYNHNMVINL